MFHLSISQASLNPYFVTAMQALEEHIAVGMRLHGLSLRRTGDTSAARTLMRTHLEGSRDRLFAPMSVA